MAARRDEFNPLARPQDIFQEFTMGIETILIVGLVIILVGVIVGLGRAKRKATRTHTGNPSTTSSGPRQG